LIKNFPTSNFHAHFLLAALAGAERVFKVMDMEPEIDEGKTDLIRVKKENGVLYSEIALSGECLKTISVLARN